MSEAHSRCSHQLECVVYQVTGNPTMAQTMETCDDGAQEDVWGDVVPGLVRYSEMPTQT